MDSPKDPSSTEGCSSSASGWTTYIVSPMEEDDDDDKFSGDENSDKNMAKDEKTADQSQESDDSMASDASSGPSRQQNFKIYRGNYGKKSSDHDKSINVSRGSSAKKSSKKGKRNDEKNERGEGRFRAFKKYWK